MVELVNAPPDLAKVRRTYFALTVGPRFSPATPLLLGLSISPSSAHLTDERLHGPAGTGLVRTVRESKQMWRARGPMQKCDASPAVFLLLTPDRAIMGKPRFSRRSYKGEATAMSVLTPSQTADSVSEAPDKSMPVVGGLEVREPFSRSTRSLTSARPELRRSQAANVI